MALKERAYMVVSNLTMLRISAEVLSEVVPDDGGEQAAKQQALRHIHQLIAAYEKKVF